MPPRKTDEKRAGRRREPQLNVIMLDCISHHLVWSSGASHKGLGDAVWSASAPHVDSEPVLVACVERYCSTLAPESPYTPCVESPLSTLSFFLSHARCVERYCSTQFSANPRKFCVEHRCSTRQTRALVWSTNPPHADSSPVLTACVERRHARRFWPPGFRRRSPPAARCGGGAPRT